MTFVSVGSTKQVEHTLVVIDKYVKSAWFCRISSFCGFISIFSLKDLVIFLLDKLLWRTGHTSIPDDVSPLYQSVADLLILSIHRREEDVNVAIDTVIGYVDKIDSRASASGIAQIALILICLSEGDWKPRFNQVIDSCISILTNSQSRHTANYFATEFIRFALNLPEVQYNIPETVIPALIAVGDSRELVDLFLVFAAKANSQ